MASGNDSHSSEFTLLQRTSTDRWAAIKTMNPDEKDLYTALPWRYFDVPVPKGPDEVDPGKGRTTKPEVASHNRLMSLVGQRTIVDQILNHENIVSIVGSIDVEATPAATDPEAKPPKSYLVWDYCASYDLLTRYQQAQLLPPGFCNESNCWNVLTALLKAITYLHDGKRLVEEGGGQRRWKAERSSWTPILHGDIAPQNVCFQKRRHGDGDEMCKLANFRCAVVLDHVISYGGEEEEEADDLDEDGDTATRAGRLESALEYETVERRNPHHHSIDTELCSLGRLVYTMMSGEGREQWIEKHYMERLSGPGSEYSVELRLVVRFLLARCSPVCGKRARRVLPLTKVVMEYFREWKRTHGS
ncbi:hypothetical protein J3F83DRAFT_599049 [Trichoderma novae-zelandiae]